MSENDTKQKILEVATELFARHGYEGASIREIAKRYGVSHMSVWRLTQSSPRPLI